MTIRVPRFATCLLLAPLLLAPLVLASGAQAQINPYRGNRNAPRLADIALLGQAGQKLLGNPAPAKGASETWSNDATGASGTVAFIGPSRRSAHGTSYACRRLQYVVTLRNRPDPRTTRLDWCRLPDGTWKAI